VPKIIHAIGAVNIVVQGITIPLISMAMFIAKISKCSSFLFSIDLPTYFGRVHYTYVILLEGFINFS
jgi:hypothetical protein